MSYVTNREISVILIRMNDGVQCIAVLLMAGKGQRLPFNDELKQFHKVEDKPLFMYAWETLDRNENIDEIFIATVPGTCEKVYTELLQVTRCKPAIVIEGGESRQESSYLALKAIRQRHPGCDIKVLIHDADRPLITDEIINENLEKVSKTNSVSTILEINDSLIKYENKWTVPHYLNRKITYIVQTPQTFMCLDELLEAHEYAREHNINVSDDCRLLIYRGYNVEFVNGSPLNFKVTKLDDLIMLESLIKTKK